MGARGKGRAFAQDLGHGDGTVAPAKGPMKRGKAKAFNTTAAPGGGNYVDQALGNGAPGHSASLGDEALTVGTSTRPYNASGRAPGVSGTARLPSAIVDPARDSGGVTFPRFSSADPQFYAKKRATERVLGRELSIEEFRDGGHYVPDDAPTAMGTSIFDPVLCEMVYRWFCPPGGKVLDPFAGGSVRGVVAGILGRPYVGIDLRAEQLHANRVQAELIFEDRDPTAQPKPEWFAGDSVKVLAGAVDPLDAFNALYGDPTLEPSPFAGLLPAPADGSQGVEYFDLVFSCPPYADLEVYSDNPADLSTMAYGDFRKVYAEIVRLACARLKPDRFACFVVGDVRDKEGNYLSLPQHTIEAFAAAGLSLYNDAILVTAAGSLPIRAGRQFAASRKLGTTHQRILVFVKGSGPRAADAVGPVDFGDLGEPEGEEEGTTADDAPPAAEPPPPAPTPVVLPASDPTPVDAFDADDPSATWWAKREDKAGGLGPEYPAGAKVRQFLAMAAQMPGAPMVVGCSADSAMQVYVAAASKIAGVPGVVFVPGRKEQSAATRYAASMGAEIVEVRPGYLSTIKARARDRAKALGAVRWSPAIATADTRGQVANLPAGVRRVVVPVGTGAIAAGIVLGLADAGRTDVEVVGVAVSDMTDADAVLATCRKAMPAGDLPPFSLVRAPGKYETPARESLPDGTRLDPFYAAKAYPFVGPGDCLWTSGVRPLAAFPAEVA